MNNNKSIIQIYYAALSYTIELNKTLNDYKFKSDYLTTYPLFKIDKDFKKKYPIISKSFFSTPYFFFYKYRKFKTVDNISLWLNKMIYYSINNFIIKNVEKYDIFIIQASLGRGYLANLNNKITLLEKWSEHVDVSQEISENEYAKRNLNINFKDFTNYDNLQIENELMEYKSVNKIIVPSNFVYKTFIEKGFDENRIVKIPLSGFDSKIFFPTSSPKKEKFKILYVGRITLNKGLAYLIDAFTKLKIKNKELNIYGVMSKDFNDYLNKNNLLDNIKIFSSVKHTELKNIYSSSDVMVLPSLFDGWGMVVTEALACGCPVITTKNTGASDIIINGENGYVVPIMDSDAIADCLNQIYKDSKKSFFNRETIVKSVDKYKDWNEYTMKYKELIENI